MIREKTYRRLWLSCFKRRGQNKAFGHVFGFVWDQAYEFMEWDGWRWFLGRYRGRGSDICHASSLFVSEICYYGRKDVEDAKEVNLEDIPIDLDISPGSHMR